MTTNPTTTDQQQQQARVTALLRHVMRCPFCLFVVPSVFVACALSAWLLVIILGTAVGR